MEEKLKTIIFQKRYIKGCLLNCRRFDDPFHNLQNDMSIDKLADMHGTPLSPDWTYNITSYQPTNGDSISKESYISKSNSNIFNGSSSIMARTSSVSLESLTNPSLNLSLSNSSSNTSSTSSPSSLESASTGVLCINDFVDRIFRILLIFF